jgi:hypothetical protein
MNQKDREFYIEYRVYLKPDARVGEVNEIAAELHDQITDIVSDECVPDQAYSLRM